MAIRSRERVGAVAQLQLERAALQRVGLGRRLAARTPIHHFELLDGRAHAQRGPVTFEQEQVLLDGSALFSRDLCSALFEVLLVVAGGLLIAFELQRAQAQVATFQLCPLSR